MTIKQNKNKQDIYNTEKCLKWIEETYGIKFNDRYDIVNKTFEYIKNHKNKIANKKSNKNVKETNLKKYDIGYFNGYNWYLKPQNNYDKYERLLKPGDIIVVRYHLCSDSGEISSYTGIMIIDSFSNNSDFSAKPYLVYQYFYKLLTYQYGMPDFYAFRKATESEIQYFCDIISGIDRNTCNFNRYSFLFELNKPKYLEQYYTKYNLIL